MTPRERILTTLAHDRPDRTPTDSWFHHEVTQMLLDHYQTTDWEVVLRELGADGWVDLSPHIEFPGYRERCCERPLRSSKRRNAVWIDERTFEDGWGVTRRMGTDERYVEWVTGPLVEAESLKALGNYRFPERDWIREPEDYAAGVARNQADERYVTAQVGNPFRTAWALRGFENLLADYLINVDIVHAIYDGLYPSTTEVAVRAARAGVDMIKVIGDVAMQDRMLMSPVLWRTIDKPRIADLIGECRKIKPEVSFFFHSDGDITEIMDDLVEIGFDVINPIQPECMNPLDVKRRWGDRITLHGGLSVQRTLPSGSAEEVRAEVVALINTCGRDGGLIVAPSNVVQPDTTVENIIACYHAARDHILSGRSVG